jgi:energy-coupling factor transporter ATP-binding protein EcfA2
MSDMRGGRALILGTSGVGNTTLIRAMRLAMEPFGGGALLGVATDGLDLTSPGWAGAPSIGDLAQQAVHAMPGEPLDGERARHAVVVIDELHRMRMLTESSGSIADHRAEQSPAPTLGFPRKYGRLSLIVIGSP